MSMQVVKGVYEECNKILAAGNAYALNNSYLVSSVPVLRKNGEKVPVFLKIADMTDSLVNADKEKTSEKLLDLLTMTNAIMYTQIEISEKSETKELVNFDYPDRDNISWKNFVNNSFKDKMNSNIKMDLSPTERESIKNIRWVKYSVDNINNFSDIAFREYFFEIVKEYGTKLLPLAGYFNNTKVEEVKTFLENAIKTEDSDKKKALLILVLGTIENSEELLTEYLKGGRFVVSCTMQSIAMQNSDKALDILIKQIKGKDYDLAIETITSSNNENYLNKFLETAKNMNENFIATTDIKEIDVKRISKVFEKLLTVSSKENVEFLISCLRNEKIYKYNSEGKVIDGNSLAYYPSLAKIVIETLIKLIEIDKDTILKAFEILKDKGNSYQSYCIFRDLMQESPFGIYDKYKGIYEDEDKSEIAFYALQLAMDQAGKYEVSFDKKWLKLMIKWMRFDMLSRFPNSLNSDILMELSDKITKALEGDNDIKRRYVSKEYYIWAINLLKEKGFFLEDKLLKIVLNYSASQAYSTIWIIETFTDESKAKIKEFVFKENNLGILDVLKNVMPIEAMQKYKNHLKISLGL